MNNSGYDVGAFYSYPYGDGWAGGHKEDTAKARVAGRDVRDLRDRQLTDARMWGQPALAGTGATMRRCRRVRAGRACFTISSAPVSLLDVDKRLTPTVIHVAWARCRIRPRSGRSTLRWRVRAADTLLTGRIVMRHSGRLTDVRLEGRLQRPSFWAALCVLVFCLPALGLAAPVRPRTRRRSRTTSVPIPTGRTVRRRAPMRR